VKRLSIWPTCKRTQERSLTNRAIARQLQIRLAELRVLALFQDGIVAEEVAFVSTEEARAILRRAQAMGF
jgi:hypothetical protein